MVGGRGIEPPTPAVWRHRTSQSQSSLAEILLKYQYPPISIDILRYSWGRQKGPKMCQKVSVGPILLSCCSCPWATSAEKQSWQLVTKFFFIKESFQLFIGKRFPFFQLFRCQLPRFNGRKSSGLLMLKCSIRKPFQKICSFHCKSS